MEELDMMSIPKEKFEFVNDDSISHDKPPASKPVGYFKDAFRRFCKNKGAIVGAIVIAFLILFAIIVPFCTPYKVSYNDYYYKNTMPYNKMFAKTNFWDGCRAKEMGVQDYIYYRAMGEETGHYAIKNQSVTRTKSGLYAFRLDTYHSIGVVYKQLSLEEYQALQEYQDANNIQVIYPAIQDDEKPKADQDSDNANYYFKTRKSQTGKTVAVLDENGNIIPVYEKLAIDDNFDRYTSKMRIEEPFVGADGVTYKYSYAEVKQATFRVRINYYEYFKYYHTQVLKDKIKEPKFFFGTTGSGQDILTCLASGARFSFIFAIVVASVNLFVGAIYGSISGYYGGKADLIMERITDILGAVPFMIVITLLKYHMGGSSQILILFIAFFLTGWMGMAGTTRMQFYRFKNQEYVFAARTLGARDRRLMFKHIFPNAIGTLVTSCALVIPGMIYSEINLSYLGIINLSTGNITSVGTLISQGQESLTIAPHIVMFPTIFLVLLMLCFNLFGNGLRDAFNPSLRGSEG